MFYRWMEVKDLINVESLCSRYPRDLRNFEPINIEALVMFTLAEDATLTLTYLELSITFQILTF